MKIKLVVILLLMTLFACASVGSRISAENLSQIKEGQTTKEQVVQLIGSPMVVSMMPEGKQVMTYSYAKVAPSAQNFIPVVGLVQSKTNMEQQIVQIMIAKDGFVERVLATDSNTNIKSGIIAE